MFGLAFLKTKSLALPLGLHFMANFMQENFRLYTYQVRKYILKL